MRFYGYIVNKKTHRKFERAANMKFVAVSTNGHWHCNALCATEDGTVYWVNRKTGEVDMAPKYHRSTDGIWSYEETNNTKIEYPLKKDDPRIKRLKMFNPNWRDAIL